MRDLETALRSRLDAGGRAFVPYVTGGLGGVDAELLRGLEEAGADAIEVGIPSPINPSVSPAADLLENLQRAPVEGRRRWRVQGPAMKINVLNQPPIFL